MTRLVKQFPFVIQGGFNERRARRILPDLFLMMLVSMVIAWNLLLPADMRDFTPHRFRSGRPALR